MEREPVFSGSALHFSIGENASTGFRLRENLHCCVNGANVIFLDVLTDRFFALPPATNDSFKSLLMNEDVTRGGVLALELLEREGLLIRVDDPDERPMATVAKRAVETSFQLAVDASARGMVLPAIFHQLLSAFMLKVRGFSATVRFLQKAKPISPTTSVAAVEEKVAEISAAFRKTRFAFRPGDRCLARGIAFTSCCYRQNIAVSLIIGVRTNPFAAHCWVQRGEMIVHDDSGQATLFTPILIL